MAEIGHFRQNNGIFFYKKRVKIFTKDTWREKKVLYQASKTMRDGITIMVKLYAKFANSILPKYLIGMDSLCVPQTNLNFYMFNLKIFKCI